jgi:predicted CopG family antitoxin
LASKTIRVQQDTWNRLEQERDWRETFDTVISRLLDIHDMLRGVEPLLKGQQAFEEFKRAQANLPPTAH